MNIEQLCSCEPPGIGNGPDPECPKHRAADEASYWRDLWQRTASGLLGAHADIERLTRQLEGMREGARDDASSLEYFRAESNRLRELLKNVRYISPQNVIEFIDKGLEPGRAATCIHGYRLEDLETGASVCEPCMLDRHVGNKP